MLQYIISSLPGYRQASLQEFRQIERNVSSDAGRYSALCGLSPNGKVYVYVMGNGTIVVNETGNNCSTTVRLGEEGFFCTEEASRTVSLALSDTHAYFGCINGSLLILNLSTKHPVILPMVHRGMINCVCVVDSTILSGSLDSTWALWDHSKQDSDDTLLMKNVGIIPDEEIKALALCAADPSKGVIACGMQAKYMDFASGKCLGILIGHGDSIRACAVQQHICITGSFDMTSRVWDLRTCEELYRLDGHLWFVLDVVLSVDLRRAVTCSLDRSCKVWDLECNGKLLFELDEQKDAVRRLSISRTARFLLTGTEDHSITLYDLCNGDAMRILALCSGRHERLGRYSPIKHLANDIIRCIAMFLYR